MPSIAEVALETLPRLPFADRQHLPQVSAVYFALADTGKVLYIGATEDVRRRWSSPHHGEKQLVPHGCAFIAWHATTKVQNNALA